MYIGEKGIKSNNGITLVSLVVMIIILLILASISVTMLMGDNGLITKAQEAKEATHIAEIKEEVQLELMEVQADNYDKHLNGNAMATALETELQEKDANASVTYSAEDKVYNVSYKECEIELSAN